MNRSLREIAPRVRSIDTRTAKPPPKRADPFYLSREWRALIAAIIHDRGRRCEDPLCKYPSRAGIRLFGDHIVELRDGGAPLDPANVMLRCGSCHTRKTGEHRALRMGRRV